MPVLQRVEPKAPSRSSESRRDDASALADPCTLLASLRESLLVTDLEGRITLWNEGATELFGYSEDEMLGQTPALLYDDAQADALGRDLDAVLAGEPVLCEWQGRAKDGRSLYLEVRTSRVLDQGGEVIGFLEVSRDITARKQAEAELDAQRRLLEHTLNVLAHDLRNPLNSLGMSLLLLEPTVVPGGGKPYLDVVARATERMKGTVRDLCDLVTVTRGDLVVHQKRLCPQEPLERVHAEARCCAAEKAVLLTSQIPPVLPEVRGDASRIEQSLLQLAHAAILRSAPEQTVTLRVTLRDDEVVYEIEDQSEAPPPDLEEALGCAEGPFRGLGITLAKGLAEAMRGRVFVEQASPGARFCLALPRLS